MTTPSLLARTALLAIGAALAASSPSRAAEPAGKPPEVRVSELPLRTTADDDKRTATLHVITLDNGLRRFGLNQSGEVRKPDPTAHQHVGWNAPDEGNWYHSAMFDLRVNGQSANTGRAAFTILESGSRGVVDFAVDNELGRFRCRFVVVTNSEVLFAGFAVEPAVEVTDLVLRLQNYPGTYKATLDGQRHRQVIGAAGTLEPRAEPYVTDPAAQWWYVYQDAIFDKAVPEYRDRTYGPSALVLPAGEAQTITTTVGSYGVPIDITYPPDCRRVRLAFFDYFGLGNKAGSDRFAKERDGVRAALEELAFEPDRLRQARDELARMTDQGLSGEAAAAVPELKRLLSAWPDGDPWRQKPITAEDRTLQLLDQYDKARWATVKAERPGIGVLVVRGLHWRDWGLDDALRILGERVRETAVSHYAEYYWKGEEISYFPATWEEMSRFDVVVLANVPFSVLGAQRAQALAEYLRAGGAVLLLGGTHAYGQAGFDQFQLGALMPVRPTRLFDLRRLDQPAPIALTEAAPAWLSANLEWSAAPAALWDQPVDVAPEGAVWLTAGAAPFLVTGLAGAGRVGALCAPPYGEPGAATTGFWTWNSWPELMARLLLWLGRGGTP